MNTLKRIVILSVFVFLNNCAIGADFDSEASISSPSTNAEFIGTWNGVCLPSQTSVANFIFYSNNTMEYISYTGSALGICDDTVRRRMTLNYAIGSSSLVVNGAVDLDIIFTGKYLMPISADSAAELNTTVACGFTDWAVGVEKDISVLSCGDMPPVGWVSYSIAKITNNILKLGTQADGSSNDGSTAELRNDALTLEDFHKVP